ncbi:hypothetical protein JCM18882A_20860 [Brevibacterium metallidurans]|uniref:Uncharacterized protein n=1 Tax=Brevibacterium metallidurans TaxID=1482676 RepID=A0ABN0SP98_9MICO
MRLGPVRVGLVMGWLALVLAGVSLAGVFGALSLSRSRSEAVVAAARIDARGPHAAGWPGELLRALLHRGLALHRRLTLRRARELLRIPALHHRLALQARHRSRVLHRLALHRGLTLHRGRSGALTTLRTRNVRRRDGMVRGTGPITGPIRALALSWARLFRHISSFSVGHSHAAVQGVLCFCSSSLRSNTDTGPSAACLFGNNAPEFRRQRLSCPGDNAPTF